MKFERERIRMRFLLAMLVCCACSSVMAGECEGGRCAVRPLKTVTKSVVKTTEKVVTIPGRAVRRLRCR